MQVSSAPIWKRLLALIYDALVVTALILISGLIASVIAQGEAPSWLTQLLIVFRGWLFLVVVVTWWEDGRHASLAASRGRNGRRTAHEPSGDETIDDVHSDPSANRGSFTDRLVIAHWSDSLRLPIQHPSGCGT